MIDWGSLAGNALWILGCALALSTLSFASWQASLNNVNLFEQLRKKGFVRAYYFAGILFCAGLAATSDKLFNIIIWIIMGLFFSVSLIFTWKNLEKEGEDNAAQ